jgi:alpha-glucosidase
MANSYLMYAVNSVKDNHTPGGQISTVAKAYWYNRRYMQKQSKLTNDLTDVTTDAGAERWAYGAVVYQIYPRSFKDSNSDGIGDLPGVIDKLDYLKELGVTALWLSPFYTSPMADFGYDVADYCDVDPIFGTLDDAKKLVAAAHTRGLRVLVDLVPNHSSDQHAWFKASSQSRDGEFADYYIWRDPAAASKTGASKNKAGKPLPPNNWIDVFSGESAWEWVEARGQFYMHSFAVQQPDLNWENPTVRQEIQNVMRFWLDLGVDGFRVDAVNFISKDPSFADDPVNPDWEEPHLRYGRLLHKNSQSGPQLHAYLTELSSVLKEDAYASRQPFMIFEGYPQTRDHIKEYLAYYHDVDDTVAAPFCFEGFELSWEQAGQWTGFLRDYLLALKRVPAAVPAYAFSNHDRSRLISRLGEARSRLAAVLLLTLPGMVFIYNGDELGMRDGVIPPELIVDPGAMDSSNSEGRDPERTPLQWSGGKNAGFSDAAGGTWLPVNSDYQTVNVEAEAQDPGSFLNLYRSLCHLRHDIPALRQGDTEMLETGKPELLGFVRQYGKQAVLVLVNFSDYRVSYQPDRSIDTILLSTHSKPHAELASLTLAPHEALIAQV